MYAVRTRHSPVDRPMARSSNGKIRTKQAAVSFERSAAAVRAAVAAIRRVVNTPSAVYTTAAVSKDDVHSASCRPDTHRVASSCNGFNKKIEDAMVAASGDF